LRSARARIRKGGKPAGYIQNTVAKIKVVKILYDIADHQSEQKIA